MSISKRQVNMNLKHLPHGIKGKFIQITIAWLILRRHRPKLNVILFVGLQEFQIVIGPCLIVDTARWTY